MYQVYHVVLLLSAAILWQTNAELKPKIPPPPDTCELVDCASGRVCRYVTACTGCPIEVRCVPIGQLDQGIDNECRANNPSQAILLETKESNSYSQLKCNQFGTRCPFPSVCTQTGTGRSICCRNQVPVKKEKPGVCPKAILICGGDLCKSDHDCTGAQKCCRACGDFICSNPETAVGCENVRCRIGQICILRPAPCLPGRACHQALIPTCVSTICHKCKRDEICKLTSTGYECVPDDLCGGCPKGEKCFHFSFACKVGICTEMKCAPE